jgi:hypothetical protein
VLWVKLFITCLMRGDFRNWRGGGEAGDEFFGESCFND